MADASADPSTSKFRSEMTGESWSAGDNSRAAPCMQQRRASRRVAARLEPRHWLGSSFLTHPALFSRACLPLMYSLVSPASPPALSASELRVQVSVLDLLQRPRLRMEQVSVLLRARRVYHPVSTTEACCGVGPLPPSLGACPRISPVFSTPTRPRRSGPNQRHSSLCSTIAQLQTNLAVTPLDGWCSIFHTRTYSIRPRAQRDRELACEFESRSDEQLLTSEV